jgi:pyridoxal phosphate enzyme (YggS family)
VADPADFAARARAIPDRLAAVRERVAQAAERAGRTDDDVTILLATKATPAALVKAAIAAGGNLIGENRVQEMVAKAPELADLPHQTHLIGPLQRNKARPAQAVADCVETVADLRLAQRLAEVAERDLAVMIQVNTSGEITKSGCPPAAALELAAQVDELPRLDVTGFMTIGLNSTATQAVARSYAILREIRDAAVRQLSPQVRQLSMGMSGDFEIAIAEGATMVRLGSAVFGPRS